MADEDTKIKDIETKSADKAPEPKVEPKTGFKADFKAPEPKKADEPKKDDKPAVVHGVVKDVEPKTTIASSVEALVHNLALEFKAIAHDGAQKVEETADQLSDNAEAFVQAVLKNIPDGSTDGSAGAAVHGQSAPKGARRMNYGDPAPEPVGEFAVSPLNDAAAAAVEAGIPVHEANSMTAPGSNI